MDILSLNVRGLHNQSKHLAIYQWLEQKQFDIICLQETFVTENSMPIFSADWSGTSYHNVSNSCHSKGVSILCHKSFNHEVLSIYSDKEGRKLLINLKHNDQTYSVVNIYAPTEVNHRKDFLSKSKQWIIERAMKTNCLIICGDFNVSLADIDRKVPNIDRSRPMFRDFMSYVDVIDSVRMLNKSKVLYSYSNKSQTIQSRIDYILCSKYIMNLAKKAYMLHPPKVPDHRAVILKLHPDVECANGYWKLNVKLLQDNDYTKSVCDTIADIKHKYSNVLNKRQSWDYCKIQIKDESIKWASASAKK